MTETLLQKLEEKMMKILTEVEELRAESQRLAQENAMLKGEKETHSRKLQDLISLFDAVNLAEPVKAVTNNVVLPFKETLAAEAEA